VPRPHGQRGKFEGGRLDRGHVGRETVEVGGSIVPDGTDHGDLGGCAAEIERDEDEVGVRRSGLCTGSSVQQSQDVGGVDPAEDVDGRSVGPFRCVQERELGRGRRQFATLQPERIRLWDGRTGEYQASLPLPSRRTLLSVSYLPDSTGLLMAATDGRTWSVGTRTSAWVQRACRTAGRNLTQAEWQQFFPTSPYQVTCPQWPEGT